MRSAPPGVVVGTGGLKQDDSAPTTKSLHPSETDTSPGTPADEGSPSRPAKSKGSDWAAAKPTKTRTPAPLSAVADAKHDATLPVAATTEQTTDAVNRLTNAVADPMERTGGAASLRTASTQPSVVASPSPPQPSPPHAVGVVSRLVSGVVNAVLSPFAASSTPGQPADAPSMWALISLRATRVRVRSAIPCRHTGRL